MPMIENQIPALTPSSIEDILGRSLGLTKNLAREFLPLWIAASILSTLQVAYSDDWIMYVAKIIIDLIFVVVVVEVAGPSWLGHKTSMLAALQEITLSKLFRLVLLGLIVMIVTFLLLFLLIIPGLVYLVNRFLAFYILILEDAPVDKAIARSKFFMTRGRWYSLNSPAMRISILTLVTFFVTFVVDIVVGLAEATVGFTQEHMTYLAAVFIGYIISNAVYTFATIAIVGFYYDVRARYDDVGSVAGYGLP